MTDRIRHLTITLDRDYREDDLEIVISSLKMHRAVAAVEPHIVQYGDYGARVVVRYEVQTQLHKAINDILDPRKEGKQP